MRWKATIAYTNGVVHEREFAAFGYLAEGHPQNAFVAEEGGTLTELTEGVAAPNFYYIASVVVTPQWSREYAAKMVDGSDEPVAEDVAA